MARVARGRHAAHAEDLIASLTAPRPWLGVNNNAAATMTGLAAVGPIQY